MEELCVLSLVCGELLYLLKAVFKTYTHEIPREFIPFSNHLRTCSAHVVAHQLPAGLNGLHFALFSHRGAAYTDNTLIQYP